MKSCICTIIKNEHQYLDEWIQYHINLGIDCIYIFEDFDSDSHKSITDNYDNVMLIPIFNIINDTEKDIVLDLKITKKSNPQFIYLKNAIKYIQQFNIYDWCFCIDCDEFITFENDNDTLSNILSLYSNYDAIILQWKCYGASGYVKKPDYISKGVVETFTEEMQGHIPIKKPYLTKPCYNLLTYKDEFFGHIHLSSDLCNWCKTDFCKDRETIVYKNIYLRHYITKSWEEYIWKIKTRGYFTGKTRTIEFFFNINSDMLNEKQKFLDELNQETLVVLPYKQGSSQGNEISIALNLWRKYCTFNYHFVVIGEFNESLKMKYPWIDFIYSKVLPKKDGQYNLHLDVQHCMEIVKIKYEHLYNGFIWMVDDNYAIKPFDLSAIKIIHYHSITFTGNAKLPTFYWNHDKWKTRLLLDKENLPHINYTTHYPCYFEFKKLKEIWDKFNMRNESYVLEDIYFNYYEHDEPVLDSEIRLGIWNYDIYKREFQKALEDPRIKFMCNSVEGWSKDLENDLMKLFQ